MEYEEHEFRKSVFLELTTEHYGKEADIYAMKTFDQFIREQSNDLNESRFLRKGGALLLARSAKKHGDDATRSLTDAKTEDKGFFSRQ